MRKLMWFTIGFGAACALGTYFWIGKWALLLAVVFSALGTGFHFLSNPKIGKPLVQICMGVAVGLIYFFAYDRVYTAPVRALDGDTVPLQIQITDYSWQTDYGSAVDGTVKIEGHTYKIRLYLNDDVQLEPEDLYRGSVKLRITTDGGVNEPTFHRSNGILLLGYQRGEGEYTHQDSRNFTHFASDLRNQLIGIIEVVFPEDTFAFAKALLLGDKTDISYEMNTAFKVSGISHVIAVSGLHMSVLFALVYMITFKRRYLLALIGIPVVVLFMAVAGFTASVTRAGIMQIMMILALCIDREYDPPTALSFAALVMLILNPLVASSVGFQLSVGSVAGIFLFMDPIRQWLLKRIPEKKNRLWKRFRRWFTSGISVTMAAQVISTPLVAIYFGTVSLISIITNLAVLWIISFTFYGVMAVCLLGFFSMNGAGVAAWFVAWPIRFIIRTAEALASLPLAAVYTESVYIVIWLALCYCMIFGLIFGKGKRPLIALCIAALGLCTALSLSWIEPMLTDHRVTVLDVGQGQCVILQSKGKTFVVDCGGDYADDAADHCAETLLSMGIQRIDGLILTHYDSDHTGGAAYLLHRIKTQALYLPVSLEELQLPTTDGTAVIWVDRDLLLEAEELKISLYAPKKVASDNENSIAVLFQTEKCDTLITGDMSVARERELVKHANLPELEVLVVGHHGSKNSTSQELLAATTPEVAIISVGKDNPYHHPAQQTLERLTAAGCAIYRTDLSGDITYRR